jgi:hypothetical protein
VFVLILNTTQIKEKPICLSPFTAGHFVDVLHGSVGNLQVPVVRLLYAMRCDAKPIYLRDAGPGFTLPANIGDLGPGITELDLGECNLIGALLLC